MARNLENPVLLTVLGIAGFLLKRDGKPVPTVHTSAPRPKPAHAKPARAKPAHPEPARKIDPGTAAAPIARTGWWTIVKRIGAEFSDNQLMTQAAAITFYALLSIFPALAALVALYGLIADPATVVQQVNSLAAVLPSGAQQILTDELKTLTTSSDKGLGWAAALGVATSIWTSNQAMKALFNALNAVHDAPEQRGFVKLTAMTLACTAGMIVFLIVAMVGVVVVPAVLGVIGLGTLTDMLVNVLRWPLLLACVALLLAVLFRFGPCRDKVVWRWISWGSAFAAIGWVLVSLLFSWYVANFGSYDKTYGSLGAVVGFMTWIWISSTVVLLGAQVDAELEKATVGQQQPRAPGTSAPATRPAAA